MGTVSFKGRHFHRDMILQSVRWYLAHALSYRDIEEIMEERGFHVDHSMLQRWVTHYAPILLDQFQTKKRTQGNRWRLDETYLRVKGEWKYYYRAVDRDGYTVDFLLIAKRDKKAALRYMKKAIGSSGKPSLDNIDKSGANTAALKHYNDDTGKRITIRRCKYLNKIVD